MTTLQVMEVALAAMKRQAAAIAKEIELKSDLLQYFRQRIEAAEAGGAAPGAGSPGAASEALSDRQVASFKRQATELTAEVDAKERELADIRQELAGLAAPGGGAAPEADAAAARAPPSASEAPLVKETAGEPEAAPRAPDGADALPRSPAREVGVVPGDESLALKRGRDDAFAPEDEPDEKAAKVDDAPAESESLDGAAAEREVPEESPGRAPSEAVRDPSVPLVTPSAGDGSAALTRELKLYGSFDSSGDVLEVRGWDATWKKSYGAKFPKKALEAWFPETNFGRWNRDDWNLCKGRIAAVMTKKLGRGEKHIAGFCMLKLGCQNLNETVTLYISDLIMEKPGRSGEMTGNFFPLLKAKIRERFADSDVRRLVISIKAGNKASKAAATKLGFKSIKRFLNKRTLEDFYEPQTVPKNETVYEKDIDSE